MSSETFETNVTAGFFTSAAFIPLLAKGTASKHGYSASIVNVASISGLMRGSSSGQFAYAASKAAMLHLSRMLGTTLSQAKIRVNTIAPGIFPSEMTQGESDEHNKSRLEGAGDSLPAGRSGNDQDMANAILVRVVPLAHGSLVIEHHPTVPCWTVKHLHEWTDALPRRRSGPHSARKHCMSVQDVIRSQVLEES
jgi:NAD(P)-dependent dehydrogenase (short-subunit alcohol dehydrogenase family)